MSRAYDNAADARLQQGGRRNLIINGGFDVWQRSTSGTSGYVADRWTTGNVNGTTTAISQQSFTIGQTNVPGEPQYYHRTVVTSASASNSLSIFEQRVEDVRTGAGQEVTISFYAKADSSKNMSLEMIQNFGSGGSSDVNTLGVQKFSLTSSWQKFTKTVTLPSISGKTIGSGSYLACNFWMDAGSSFNSRTDSLGNQSGTFDIALMQLELGNVATPFEHRSYGEELALCERYYQSWGGGNAYEYLPLFGGAVSSTRIEAVMQYKRDMRTSPTISYSGNWQWLDGVSTFTFGNILKDSIAINSVRISDNGISGVSQYRFYLARANNDSTARFKMDAEL